MLVVVAVWSGAVSNSDVSDPGTVEEARIRAIVRFLTRRHDSSLKGALWGGGKK